MGAQRRRDVGDTDTTNTTTMTNPFTFSNRRFPRSSAAASTPHSSGSDDLGSSRLNYYNNIIRKNLDRILGVCMTTSATNANPSGITGPTTATATTTTDGTNSNVEASSSTQQQQQQAPSLFNFATAGASDPNSNGFISSASPSAPRPSTSPSIFASMLNGTSNNSSSSNNNNNSLFSMLNPGGPNGREQRAMTSSSSAAAAATLPMPSQLSSTASIPNPLPQDYHQHKQQASTSRPFPMPIIFGGGCTSSSIGGEGYDVLTNGVSTNSNNNTNSIPSASTRSTTTMSTTVRRITPTPTQSPYHTYLGQNQELKILTPSHDQHQHQGIEPFPEKLHRLLLEVEATGRDDIVSFVGEKNDAFMIKKPVSII